MQQTHETFPLFFIIRAIKLEILNEIQRFVGRYLIK